MSTERSETIPSNKTLRRQGRDGELYERLNGYENVETDHLERTVKCGSVSVGHGSGRTRGPRNNLGDVKPVKRKRHGSKAKFTEIDGIL